MSERRLQFDVVVVGGGTAGVAAAIGAATVGMRTLLIEKNPYFGGAVTHSSVLTFCGFFAQQEPIEQVVGGVGQQLLDNLGKLGIYAGPYRSPRTGNVIVLLDAEATKYALDKTVQDSDVTPRLHCQVIGASVAQNGIREIECYDHNGRFRVEAKAFVDASGEADLSALAGAEVRFGDDEGRVQAGTLVMRIGGVAADADLNRNLFTKAVLEAKRDGEPYLTKQKGMVLRLPGSNDVLAMFADEAVDGLDSASLTEAEMSARRQSWAYLNLFRRVIPGFEHAFLSQTGPSIGIRETRHVLGEYTLRGEDALSGAKQEDGVARGGWPVEIHKPGVPAEYQHIRDKSFYDIPLRALKVRGLDNLWCAGRIISCDPIAFASARVMGTAFATGHAAGVAAAHYAAMKRVDVTSVRAELVRQGAFV
ncbi:FAD-dependent oxidoreductase [Alicyclobacillus fodiniaquatilis]|uniref:FAD-dependent oxidoreductase n=1 Tax=Alicyclobacillus fodiniaquatilis TaxID=1661150 RepID=A0ABW4JMW5_9BACL